MKRSVWGVMVLVSGLLAACSVTTRDGAPGDGDGSPSGSPSGAPSSSGNPSGGTPPAASSTEAEIETNAACPAFAACGGAPSGTYDYTGGCVGDVFAAARQQCPGMQTANVKSTVKGSVFFLGSNALERDVTTSVSGTLVFPADCTLGQCATVENALAGSFDSAKCTVQAGGCNCAVSRTDKTKNATTYTISGTSLTTADGDVYAICEKGGTLGYRGKSTNAEEGNFTLAKR